MLEDNPEPPTVNYAAWLTTQRHAAGFRELYDAANTLLNGDLQIYDPSQAVELGHLLLAMLTREKAVRDEEAAAEEQDPSTIKRIVREARELEGD